MRALRVVLALCLLAGTACGYSLAGRGNALPPELKIIGIPAFVNHSATPEIDRVLTDAVRTEWQGKSRFRVVPDETGVDAVLHATISSVGLQPVAFNSSNQATRNVIIVTANVEFKELATGKVIWANPAFQARDEYEISPGSSPNDPTAILTQNVSAMDRIGKAFARSVVTAIFEAF